MTLVCIGCGKAFQTQRSLSAHEARCNANKQLTTDIYARHHKRRTKSKKRKERSLSESDSSESSQHEDGPSRHSPSPIPSFSIDVGEVQAEVEALPGHLPAPPSPVGPPPVVSARSGRHVRLPARYRDFLPGELLSLDHVPPPPLQSPPPASQRSDSQPASKSSEFRTEADSFGLFRIYPNQPTHIPHVKTTLSDVVDAPTLLQTSAESAGLPNIIPPSEITVDNLFSAFSSPTAGLLMCWHYTKSTAKTKEELNRIWVYISDPLFNPSQQPNFSHDREYRLASKYLQDDSNPFRAQHGWTRGAVTIPLIKEGVKYTSETDLTLPTLIIDNIYHRSITDIMTSVFSDHASSSFHFTPFNQYWTTADGRDVRIYSEAYMSAEMDEAHRQINAAPRQPDDDFERVVVPIMLWSDATQLANFGDASLWPVYLYFGNQSKYIRGKPTSGACHHVAYIPSLPDNFQDTYTQNHSEASTGELYTHFKRELMHAVWGLLLDGKFVEAHKTGILIECVDHIIRRFFPRLYSYSADYPEKVLLACIKFLGNCLCPRCFVEKAAVPDMGKPSDMMTRTTQLRVNNNAYQSAIKAARKLIFGGKSLNSKRVTDLLKDTSWVPTRNAFSERLSEDRELFNFFLLFVVDLLHEFELGVWKAIFTHLMRILHAQGGSSITELNWRYRATPTFGRGTIRRFHKNASSMKRLAARDFEDLLQCAIPVFEGLLPSPHNETVLDLLFDLATWQAFAKLRMHTDDTLSFFDTVTRQLGYSARRFNKTTCSSYQTTELPQESAARARRRAATIAKEPQAQETSSAAKIKKLNLSTYKFHALGDYPEMIRQYGTTDSYSTQIGELEHRRSKRRFARSGKRKETRTASIANQEAIERFISKVDATREALRTVHTKKNQAGGRRTRTRPEEHYHIAASTRNAHDLTVWLGEKEYDPAVTDFIPRLKDHLLARKRGLAYNGDEYDFSDQDRSCIIIHNNQLFEHAFLRVNYTTYDLRREQDSINPRTRPDIMLLSQEDEHSHPYWYARVCAIFHMLVEYRPDVQSAFSKPERMDVLFVRWFRRDINFDSGWDAKRLPRIQFFDAEHPAEAFGFVHPDSVIRGIHLIPTFTAGPTHELLSYDSFVRQDLLAEGWESQLDWRFFYVNIFVDRDIFMRFRGGGVGHKITRDWDELLQREGRHNPPSEDSSDEGSSSDSEDDMEGNEELGEDEAEEAEAQGGTGRIDDGVDVVVADDGEELDEVIWDAEGYDAL